MKWNAPYLAAYCVVGSALVLAQGAGEVPRATETTAPNIRGMPDGSLLFTHQDLKKIVKIDNNGKLSTYLDTTLYIVTRGVAYKVAMLAEGVKGRAK